MKNGLKKFSVYFSLVGLLLPLLLTFFTPLPVVAKTNDFETPSEVFSLLDNEQIKSTYTIETVTDKQVLSLSILKKQTDIPYQIGFEISYENKKLGLQELNLSSDNFLETDLGVIFSKATTTTEVENVQLTLPAKNSYQMKFYLIDVNGNKTSFPAEETNFLEFPVITESKVGETVTSSTSEKNISATTESETAQKTSTQITEESTMDSFEEIEGYSGFRNVPTNGILRKILNNSASSDIAYYNSFLSEDLFQKGADFEGSFAVLGNIYNIESTSFGAAFEENRNIVGEKPRDNQLISLLLGGNLYVNKFDVPFGNGKGYFLYEDGNNVESYLTGNEKNVLPVNKSDMEQIIKRLIESKNAAEKEMDNIAKHGDNLAKLKEKLKNSNSTAKTEELEEQIEVLNQAKKYIYVKQKGGGNWDVEEIDDTFLSVSLEDPHVVIVNVKAINNENNILNWMQIRRVEQLIKDSKIKHIVFHSDDEKIVQNIGYYNGSEGNLKVLDYGDIKNINEEDKLSYQELAKKITYYYPVAQQITDYIKTDGSYPDDFDVRNIPKEELKTYVLGSDSTPNKYFDTCNIPSNNPSLTGSVIAPNAKIIWSGINLNGRVIAKSIYGLRSGFEVHNMNSNFNDKFKLRIYKQDKETKEPLEGAEFVLYREEKPGSYGVLLEDGSWKTVSDTNSLVEKVRKFVSDSKGYTVAYDIPNDLNNSKLYFKEVKAPNGYEIRVELINANNADSVDISESQLDFTYTVSNSKTPDEDKPPIQPLPNTGGTSKQILLTISLLTLSISGTYWIIRRKY